MGEQVPVELVLQYVSQLCSPCQEKWRQMMVPTIKPPSVPRQNRTLMTKTMNKLLSQVSRETGIPIAMIQMRSNDAKIVEARRKISIQARKFGIPYTFIAGIFHKHHTTIIHLVEGKVPRATNGHKTKTQAL